MSTPYPQRPAGQVPQVVPQAGAGAQPAGQGYSTAPQGFAPGYAPVPQGPVVQKVNRLSIILGIVGWVLIGLTILVMVLAIQASASDPDPSGKEVDRFLSPLCPDTHRSGELSPVVFRNRGGRRKPKTLKLNWLGILLNVSPYVIFTVLPFLLAVLFHR